MSVDSGWDTLWPWDLLCRLGWSVGRLMLSSIALDILWELRLKSDLERHRWLCLHWKMMWMYSFPETARDRPAAAATLQESLRPCKMPSAQALWIKPRCWGGWSQEWPPWKLRWPSLRAYDESCTISWSTSEATWAVLFSIANPKILRHCPFLPLYIEKYREVHQITCQSHVLIKRCGLPCLRKRIR